MSWFWGGSSSSGGKDDPTKSLDADLKEFLDQQQPKPYTPVQLPTPPTQNEPQKQSQEVPSLQTPDRDKLSENRPLPKESLFQDGRYAHLWKTYVPQSEIVAATENPIDRIVNARKDRRAGITRAAMENCVFEQELKQNCLGIGMSASVKSRMTMCQEETKAWNRCYSLQARFLQALGYMTDLKSTQEEDEKIQMHADKLYHRMMDYEAKVAEARQTGTPIPPLASLFEPGKPAPTLQDIQLPQHVMEKMKIHTPLEELPAHERELVARAAMSEVKFGNTHADDFFAATTTLSEERKKRQAWMVKTFGEPIGKFFIPDAPESLLPDPVASKPEELGNRIWRSENAANTEKSGADQSHG